MPIYTLRLFVVSILIVSILWSSGCAVTVKDIVVESVDVAFEGSIEQGLRVHTAEGYVVIFPRGVQVTPEQVHGEGRLYGLNPDEGSIAVMAYPKADIVAMEYVTTEVDAYNTAAMTTLTILTLFGSVMLLWFITELTNGAVGRDGTPDGD